MANDISGQGLSTEARSVSVRGGLGSKLMSEPVYALGRTAGEYARLIEQAQIMRPLTERMLHAAARHGMLAP